MKISLVTVAYNSAATIRDTIESVLKQDYADLEYIIVDGKSKDNTVEIIKEYEPRFNGRMRWSSEKDAGLYDAMNKGIRMATGEVVGILNSDDFYHRTDSISLVADTFARTGTDAVYSDVLFVNPDDLNTVVRYYSSAKFTLARFRFGFMPAHPTFFTKKCFFEQFGYYMTDYQISADYELLIRFMYKNRIKTQYIPADFMTMRMGGTSSASWKRRWVLTYECIRAARGNGLYTNLFLLLLKYPVKIFEYIRK